MKNKFWIKLAIMTVVTIAVSAVNWARLLSRHPLEYYYTLQGMWTATKAQFPICIAIWLGWYSVWKDVAEWRNTTYKKIES